MNVISACFRTVRRHWHVAVLVLLMAAYACLLSYFSIRRHEAFASGFDLANMDQTVWNTLHGRFFSLTSDIGTISRFSIHSDLILVFLTPFYLLWNDVRVLLILQSVALALGAVPIYLLSEKVLKNKTISLLLALIYLLNPAMQWANIYDFHPVTFVIPLFLFSVYAAYMKRWKWFAVAIFFALLTKEEIGLTVALLGVVVFFLFKKRLTGIATFLVGVICFYITIFILIPHFSPGGVHWALSWYRTDVNEKFGVVFLFNSLKTFLGSPARDYYGLLLKPWSFVSLLGMPWIFLTVPELSANVLSTHAQMESILFHYQSGVIPWLAIGAIFALYYVQWVLKKISFTKKYEPILIYFIVTVMLVVSVRVSYHYGPLPPTPSCWCISYNVTTDDTAFEKLLSGIPENASITASPEIRPHLTHRENAYTLPNEATTADFIAIIDQNRLLGNYNPKVFELQLITELDANKNYSLVRHIGHFYLYRKNTFSSSSMLQ